MTRESLVQELHHRALRELTKEAAVGLVSEITAHLDQAVQARLELGLSQQQAEAEAVASLGSPRDLVREVKKANPRSAKAPGIDHGVLYAMIAGHVATSSFVIWSFGAEGTRVISPVTLCFVWGLIAAWLFVASWRSRRLQLFPAFALLVPAIVVTSIGLSAVLYADPGFNTYVGTRKKDIARLMEEAKQRARNYQVSRMDFDKEFNTYLAGVSSGALKGEQRLMAPRWISTYNRLDMYRFENAESARAAWVMAAGQVHEFNSANQRNQMDSAHRLDELKERHAVVNWFLHLPSGAFFASGYGFFMLGISAIAWLIRSIYEVLKARWRWGAT